MNGGKKKVLVVEDDVNLRSIASLILRGRGFEVLEAGDGQDALQLVDMADIVLLDLFLPHMTGEEFLETIRGKGNYVPVVVMSAGYGREAGAERLKEYGIVEFVPKPFPINEMAEKIAKAARVADDMESVHRATDSLKGFIERQTAKE